jgi:hypothetical protein
MVNHFLLLEMVNLSLLLLEMVNLSLLLLEMVNHFPQEMQDL